MLLIPMLYLLLAHGSILYFTSIKLCFFFNGNSILVIIIMWKIAEVIAIVFIFIVQGQITCIIIVF